MNGNSFQGHTMKIVMPRVQDRDLKNFKNALIPGTPLVLPTSLRVQHLSTCVTVHLQSHT